MTQSTSIKTAPKGTGMNGSLKWIAQSLFIILMAVLAYAVNGNDSKIDTVKADSASHLNNHIVTEGHPGNTAKINKIISDRRVDSTVTANWRSSKDSTDAKTARTVEAIARSLGVSP